MTAQQYLLFMQEAEYNGTFFKVFVTENPDQLEPEQTFGNIVVMPGRALVSLVAIPAKTPQPEEPVMLQIAEKLRDEVVTECSTDCEARIERFDEEIIELEGRVLAVGVVCSRACDFCPAGIRDTL
jgi:hypothetical protein